MAGPTLNESTRSWAAVDGFGRRTFLKGLGMGAGALLAHGLPFAFSRETSGWGYQECVEVLGASLTPEQRRLMVFAADHPSRQLTRDGPFLRRPHVGALLTRQQFTLLRRLFQTLASERGIELLSQPVGFEAGGLDGCVLAFYGDPVSGRADTLLMGSHLALRGGGASREGAAFGGPMTYGHLTGNAQYRLPGNAFAPQCDAANRLYALLDVDERLSAQEPEPPHELLVQVQGEGAAFPGVPIRGLAEEAREHALHLVETVLASYPQVDSAEALSCIEHNGGIDALHVSYYESRGYYPDGAVYSELSREEQAGRPDLYWQVWRVEGPGTVLHFNGYPHVHVHLNVARDPVRQRVGETLAETPTLLEGDSLRALLEAALRSETGAPHALYPDAVPSRFAPGPVTTGLAWSLDPYANHPAVATYRGRAMTPRLREHLVRRGTTVEPDRSYRIATTDYYTRREDLLGTPDAVEVGAREVREVLVDYIRAHGLAAARSAAS